MSENTDNTLTSYLGPEFQQRLMWQLLVEPEFAEKTIPSLAIEYFDDPNLKRLFMIMLEFYKEFEKVPNLQNQSILQAIAKYRSPNNTIEEESLSAVIKRIELWNERIINKQLLYDGDVVRNQTTWFIKQQEYRKIGEFIIGKTKTGEMKNKSTIANIEEMFQKVAHIGDEEDYGIDVFDNIKHALRKEFRQTIPTGIGVIDLLTGGGLGKGEIGVILTPSGVGKTTALTKIANSAYDEKKNVCQIVFEDTKEQIQRKHFTIWSGIPLSKIDDNNEKVEKIAVAKCEEMKGSGKLVIKKFSQENTTMMDIRKWMINYQKKYGFKFDILVLDYLDCLESHKKSPDRNEAELVIIKSFEALASDFDIPAWTAIQTNRSGFNAEYVEAYQTGGSIKRIQKAHFFMSVAKTKEQQEANFANIRILKARFAKDGQAFDDCIFNNDTMQIIIEDKRYPVQTKGLKHHDSEDVDKLDETAKALQKKSSDIDLHVAVNKQTMGTLLERINDPTINDYIPDRDAPIDINQFVPKIEKEVVNEPDDVNEGAIEGAVGGAKNDELLDIEDIPIERVKNDGVNDGVSEGVNDGVNLNSASVPPEKDDKIGWSGQSFTVGTNEKEVKLEDIPPLIIKKEEIISVEKEKKSEEIQIISPQVIRNVEEIIKNFTDPDAPSNEHMEMYERIKKAEKHQNILGKK